MRKVVVTLLVGFTFGVLVPSAFSQQKPAPEPIFVKFCDLLADRTKYLGKVVRTEAKLEYWITMEYVVVATCAEKKVSIPLGISDELMSNTIETLSDEMNSRRVDGMDAELIGMLKAAPTQGKPKGYGHYGWSTHQFEVVKPIEIKSSPKR
jgi:hypothetical protein